MINNEAYVIEADVKTSKAKRALQDLASYIRNFGKQAEKETNLTPMINPNISKKELFEWRKDLQNSLKEAQRDLANYGKTPTGKFYQKDVENLQEGLELVNNRIKEIEESEKSAADGLEEMDNEGSKSSSVLSTLFDKSISKIKRFTYYLLGARSVFSLFRKYQSIYFQYNDQMQYQTELSQNAIALSLAPAFEFLGNVIAYASIAFAKFIELLTGVNVLSKVSTKGIRDYNKSLKETQTLVSGIDEITNLSLPSNVGLGSQYKALADFQQKIAEVEQFFNNNKWIQDLANGLKIVWQFLVDNIYPILTDVFDIVAEIVGFVWKVGEVIYLILERTGLIRNVLKPLWDIVKSIWEVAKTILEIITDILNWDIDKLIDDLAYLWDTITGSTTNAKKKINAVFEEYKNGKKTAKSTVNEILSSLEDLSDKSREAIIDNLSDDIREVFDIARQEINGTGDVVHTFKDGTILSFKEIVSKSKAEMNNLGDTIDDTFEDRETNIKVKVDTSSADYKLQQLFKKYALEGYIGGTANGLLSVIKATPHANGLDYVPYDEYPALLHKGEAVVPAKYNPTIHGMGNEYTNSLLETLVVKMDDLSRRPNVVEIDGQQFVNATYNLYDDERQRQNYVEGVVR